MFPCQIEAIMNDFIQLIPQSNVYEAETMVEGQLVFSVSVPSDFIIASLLEALFWI
jgi:hypothetical protein